MTRQRLYFRVETDSGQIVLQGDLTNELYDEYRLVVRAYDQGEPSLHVTTTVVISVQQVVTVPPNSGLGFASLEHDIKVLENHSARGSTQDSDSRKETHKEHQDSLRSD